MRARAVGARVGAMLGLYAHSRTNDERLYEILRILRPLGRKSAQDDGGGAALARVDVWGAARRLTLGLWLKKLACHNQTIKKSNKKAPICV